MATVASAGREGPVSRAGRQGRPVPGTTPPHPRCGGRRAGRGGGGAGGGAEPAGARDSSFGGHTCKGCCNSNVPGVGSWGAHAPTTDDTRGSGQGLAKWVEEGRLGGSRRPAAQEGARGGGGPRALQRHAAGRGCRRCSCRSRRAGVTALSATRRAPRQRRRRRWGRRYRWRRRRWPQRSGRLRRRPSGRPSRTSRSSLRG
jgi:hypothetical protein